MALTERGGARAFAVCDAQDGDLALACGQILARAIRARGKSAISLNVPIGRRDVDGLARAFDVIVFAFGPATSVGGGIPPLPSIILVPLGEGSAPAAASFIERLLGDGSPLRPAAFVIWIGEGPRGLKEEALGPVAAAMEGRLRLPFWGLSDESEKIASLALERSRCLTAQAPASDVAGITAQGDPGSCPASLAADAADNNDGLREAVRRVVAALRREAEFKELGTGGRGVAEARSLRQRVAAAARRLIAATDVPIPSGVDHEAIVARVLDDTVGFGPIESLLADPEVTEVMVVGPSRIYAERRGRIAQVPLQFEGAAHLMAVIERMVAAAGRRVDESSPMVDARLPDGSRLNAIIPPLAVDGPAVTVRRFSKAARSLPDAVASGMLSSKAAEFLAACVRARAAVVISGGTGAGKTTLLGMLASQIDPAERVVTIEDAAELSIPLPHVVRLEARPPGIGGAGAVTIRDLVKNALRMRPDRIVVGECRGPEALDMLQAMNTGHEGSLTTVHANSPRDALARIETMVLMAGVDLPIASVREQIVRAVDIVVQLARVGAARRAVEIAEFTGMEGAVPCMQTLARAAGGGALESTGLAPRFAERLKARGVHLPPL